MLPALDDELARTASEFDTFAELRAEIEERLRGQVADELDGLFRAAAIDELVKASKVTASGPLVELRTRELPTGLRAEPAGARHRRGHLPPAHRSVARAARAAPTGGGDGVGGTRLVLEAVADSLGLEVTDDEIRAELREAGEDDEEIDAFIEAGGADRVRDDLRLKKALDRIAAEVKPIAPELHEARESIWTPGQEQQADAPKLWTPGTKE